MACVRIAARSGRHAAARAAGRAPPGRIVRWGRRQVHGPAQDADAAPFTAAETHGVALRPGNRRLADSEGLGWRSLFATAYTEAPNESIMPGVADDLLIHHVRGPVSVGRVLGADARETRHCTPRQFTLVPAGVPSRWIVPGRPEVLHVYPRRVLLDRLVQDSHRADPARVAILPRFAVHDPLLEQLALSVVRAMRERPPGHALYVDCLAQAMAAHLVQHHSTLTRPARVPKPDGLADWRLRRLADYIEAELAGDVSLDAMAEQVGLSPLYLTRAFKRAFGRPPHAYVTERRIERAKHLLRSTDLPIAEVALATGFADQSHFTGVFRKLVGTPPGRYRSGR